MTPGNDSILNYIVFLFMGLILGYGFWGSGENANVDLKLQLKTAVERVESLRGNIGSLKREIERHKRANFKNKTEYNRIIAELKKRKKTEELKEGVTADTKYHPEKKLKHSELFDETGRKDERNTIIQDHTKHPIIMRDIPVLAGTGWLANRIYYPGMKLVFVDSWPPRKKDYDAGHIPGSVYMGISGLMRAIGNGSTPPDRELYESMMSKLGISNDDYVVLYGAAGKNDFTLAAYWLMEYFGHGKLSYLNGGLAKWNREKRPVTMGYSKPAPASYKAGPAGESVRIAAAEVLESLKNPDVVIVDVRGSSEYIGKVNLEKNKRVGHIPGAVDLDHYLTNFKLNDGTIKFVSDLKAVYEANGVTKDKEIIVYCQAGIRASNTYFVLKHVLGYPNVKNYIGSWSEWGNRVDFSVYPVEGPSEKDFEFKSVKDAGTKFIGVKKCKACHMKQYKSWQKTKMAMSFENLRPGIKAAEKLKVGLNPNMDFTKDPECLGCHTTGYGKPGGFVSFEETPEMAGVQCEECHGAGDKYRAIMRKNKNFRLPEVIEVGLVLPFADEKGCLKCHNDKSPFNEKVDAKYKFDFKERVKGSHENYPLKYEH